MACLRMRVVDRSVLQLIRMWLETLVVEPGGDGGGPEQWSRSKQGTPQGGVISPLLANGYLHWFDKLFHRADGSAGWAKAKLVRYADGDQPGQDPRSGSTGRASESGLSGLYLSLATRPVWPPPPISAHGASKKALQRERERINEMTDRRQGCTPIPQRIDKLNRQLEDWANQGFQEPDAGNLHVRFDEGTVGRGPDRRSLSYSTVHRRPNTHACLMRNISTGLSAADERG